LFVFFWVNMFGGTYNLKFIQMKKPNLKPVVLQMRKKAMYFITVAGALSLLAIGTNAQTLSTSCLSPSPNLHNPVNDAIELWETLSELAINPGSYSYPLTIDFGPDVFIDLGQLPVDAFPLYVGDGVTLQGDYDLFHPTGGNLCYGTKIYFPWMFENGLATNMNGTNSNNVNGSAFRIGQVQENPDDLRMGAHIRNICLIGPKNDSKDYRFYNTDQWRDMCTPSEHTSYEGLSSGIIVNGNNCSVQDCEIFGFPHFGCQLLDMIVNAAGYNGEPANFNFINNYVHHCKEKGYGYGLWISGGSGQEQCSDFSNASRPLCDQLTNDPEDFYYNFQDPDENAHITGCYFFENQHDIDATRNRNNMFISQCTFSYRCGETNIYRHNSRPWVCNPAPFTNFGMTNQEPTRATLTQVGGNFTGLYQNVFYNYAYNFKSGYPNVNPCANTNFNHPARIEMFNNYFNTPANIMQPNTNICEWQDLNLHPTCSITPNNCLNGFLKFEIGAQPSFNWNMDNPAHQAHFNLGNQLGMPNFFEDLTDYYGTNANAQIPFSRISSTPDPANIAPDDLPKQVLPGGSLFFDTELCFDRNMGTPAPGQNNIVFVWGFHEGSNNALGDVRTDALNQGIGNALEHVFVADMPGTRHVTLKCIDNTNGSGAMRASDIVTQEVVVGPPLEEWPQPHLIFWIKDTYSGRHLDETDPNSATVTYPATCSWATNNRADKLDDAEVPEPETGFEKYAEVNGITVWTDDIAGDEGWQYIDVPLGCLYTHAIGEPEPPVLSTIEIGIRAVNPVDAERVRGVQIFVDDVYVNNAEGANLILNGGFEEMTDIPELDEPIPNIPTDWGLFNEGDFGTSIGYTFPMSCPPTPPSPNSPTFFCWDHGMGHYNLKVTNGAASRYEPHSGRNSYWGSINMHWGYTVQCGGLEYSWVGYYNDGTAATTYHTGKYKAVVQENVHIEFPECIHWRMAFDASPNPLHKNQPLAIKLKNYQTNKKVIARIFDATGMQVYEGNYYSAQFEINAALTPGIYMLKIENGEQTGISQTKKIVVIE